jgi:hypothetical protein
MRHAPDSLKRSVSGTDSGHVNFPRACGVAALLVEVVLLVVRFLLWDRELEYPKGVGSLVGAPKSSVVSARGHVIRDEKVPAVR